MSNIITQIDFFFLNMIQDLIVGDKLTPIMKFFTTIGNSGIIWVIIGIILVLNRRTRKAGIIYLICLLCEFILVDHVIKNMVCRARPFVQDTTFQLLISAPSGYSFPSGHSASSFCCAAYLYRYRRYLGVPAYILACVIAFSRLYFYVHFPSDVIVGAIIGTLIGIIGAFFCNLFADQYSDRDRHHGRRRRRRHHKRRRNDDYDFDEEYDD